MAISGVVLVFEGGAVAPSAFQAQKADGVVSKLRNNGKMTAAEVSAGIDALDKAVALQPVAGRYFQRSELESGSLSTPYLEITPAVRTARLRRVKADLELGLAHAPARPIEWLRLATTKQALDGASGDVVQLLLMAIRTGPWIEYTFYTRVRLIVDNWAYLSEDQKAEMQKYASEMWRRASDKRFFGYSVFNPVDELIIRNLLRDEPGAQEKLTTWILTK
jgi:hypothetical protein